MQGSVSVKGRSCGLVLFQSSHACQAASWVVLASGSTSWCAVAQFGCAHLPVLDGGEVPIDHHAAQAGDVRRTGGETAKARVWLNCSPQIALAEGIAEQVPGSVAGLLDGSPNSARRRSPGVGRRRATPVPGHCDQTGCPRLALRRTIFPLLRQFISQRGLGTLAP